MDRGVGEKEVILCECWREGLERLLLVNVEEGEKIAGVLSFTVQQLMRANIFLLLPFTLMYSFIQGGCRGRKRPHEYEMYRKPQNSTWKVQNEGCAQTSGFIVLMPPTVIKPKTTYEACWKEICGADVPLARSFYYAVVLCPSSTSKIHCMRGSLVYHW